MRPEKQPAVGIPAPRSESAAASDPSAAVFAAIHRANVNLLAAKDLLADARPQFKSSDREGLRATLEPKLWGCNRSLGTYNGIRIEHASIAEGGYSSAHWHERHDNLFYVVSGALRVYYYTRPENKGDALGEPYATYVLDGGMHLLVPAGTCHRFGATAKTELIEVYWEADTTDITRIDEGGTSPVGLPAQQRLEALVVEAQSRLAQAFVCSLPAPGSPGSPEDHLYSAGSPEATALLAGEIKFEAEGEVCVEPGRRVIPKDLPTLVSRGAYELESTEYVSEGSLRTTLARNAYHEATQKEDAKFLATVNADAPSDGSVHIVGGAGEEILMAGGKIRISAPGGIEVETAEAPPVQVDRGFVVAYLPKRKGTVPAYLLVNARPGQFASVSLTTEVVWWVEASAKDAVFLHSNLSADHEHGRVLEVVYSRETGWSLVPVTPSSEPQSSRGVGWVVVYKNKPECKGMDVYLTNPDTGDVSTSPYAAHVFVSKSFAEQVAIRYAPGEGKMPGEVVVSGQPYVVRYESKNRSTFVDLFVEQPRTHFHDTQWKLTAVPELAFVFNDLAMASQQIIWAPYFDEWHRPAEVIPAPLRELDSGYVVIVMSRERKEDDLYLLFGRAETPKLTADLDGACLFTDHTVAIRIAEGFNNGLLECPRTGDRFFPAAVVAASKRNGTWKTCIRMEDGPVEVSDRFVIAYPHRRTQQWGFWHPTKSDGLGMVVGAVADVAVWLNVVAAVREAKSQMLCDDAHGPVRVLQVRKGLGSWEVVPPQPVKDLRTGYILYRESITEDDDVFSVHDWRLDVSGQIHSQGVGDMHVFDTRWRAFTAKELFLFKPDITTPQIIRVDRGVRGWRVADADAPKMRVAQCGWAVVCRPKGNEGLNCYLLAYNAHETHTSLSADTVFAAEATARDRVASAFKYGYGNVSMEHYHGAEIIRVCKVACHWYPASLFEPKEKECQTTTK
jgi:mannose-6-phosphate isomerase-like protein (cupin superfamily)